MEEDSLGKRLAAIRGKRGLSLQALADMTGMQAQNLSRIEKGKRDHVRSDILLRLIHALDCSADYLLGETTDPRPRRSRSAAS